jgi:peptidoglycan hydrolase FlgJ
MLRAETFSSSVAPTPATSFADRATGFSAAYSRVRQDVLDSIQHGFSSAGSIPCASLASLANVLSSPVLSADAALPPSGGAVASEAQRRDFLERIRPWASQAASVLGLSEDLVAAHAALESGWGMRPVRTADGDSSHNLFGIKAGTAWDGATADAATHEYVGGTMLATIQRFRAYGNESAAFSDYAQLLQSSRYSGARAAGTDIHAFARGLVQGGYATDPAYAQKLVQVAQQIRSMGPR